MSNYMALSVGTDWDRASDRDWAGALATLPLFDGVGKRDLRKIASDAEFAEFAPGDTVVITGAPADFFYVILSGEAIPTARPAGRTLSIGDYFGEMGLLDGNPRSASIVAATELHVMRLPRSAFLTAIERRPELLTAEEERLLVAELERLEFQEIRMHGVVAKRTARHFGLDYDYERRSTVATAEPVPDWLEPVRARAAALAAVGPEDLVEALVQRYPEGAQIGWHRDAPAFDVVVGVSLLSASRMRFRRDVGGERHTYELVLEPRSGYVLSGLARTAWKHHVPPTKSLRYSITFRTLKDRKPGV
jgi:alkylated DNA repair protein (DNA oxidative demethylase)